MDSKNQSRRDFLKLSLLSAAALGTLALRPLAAHAQAGKVVMIEENDPAAKALGYHKDARKVDPKKWPKRAAADGKTQFCHNCMLFNNGKVTKDKTAGCALFAGKHVEAEGWCNGWNLNPAAKAK